MLTDVVSFTSRYAPVGETDNTGSQTEYERYLQPSL